MRRDEARRIVGNRAKWELRHMCNALQLHSWNNTSEDWRRLRALRALGFKVRIEIPEESDGGRG